MRLSIGIPAYNRPAELADALESIADQCTSDVEIVIIEDNSPRRHEISEVVETFKKCHPELIVRFHLNEQNIGYDANLRRLLEISKGDYVFFLGDDDLVPKESISHLLRVLEKNEPGVVIRAWRSFDGSTGKPLDEHRYFDGDRLFEPSINTVAAFFRRSIFISGLTIDRKSACNLSSDKFDGTLLYQLYLVGHILKRKKGYYIDMTMAERRTGGQHFFGSSANEKGFQVGRNAAQHSLQFVAGLFKIARNVDDGDGKLYNLILNDVSNYSYPLLEVQASQLSRGSFINYANSLMKFGLWRSGLFWLYFGGLLILGSNKCNSLIRWIYKIKGRTPVLSSFQGKKV